MRRGIGSVYDKWNNMLYLSLGMPRFFSMNAATSTACSLFFSPNAPILYTSTLPHTSVDPPWLIIWSGCTLTVTYWNTRGETHNLVEVYSVTYWNTRGVTHYLVQVYSVTYWNTRGEPHYLVQVYSVTYWNTKGVTHYLVQVYSNCHTLKYKRNSLSGTGVL